MQTLAFSRNRPSPIWHWQSVLLGGLALSIGWGIRGNFGHEYGAAFAGCLAAIVISLLSGRSDWQQRVLYFAFFGAIGWGFGASVSYMQVIAYTQSGHSSTQLYGYAALFYIGFLWAGLGGAGTALAAVAERERLVQLFKPILFVFGIWFLQDLFEDPLANALQSGIKLDHTESRHKSPLYWFDADYLAASTALLAMGIYDLLDQKTRQAIWLPVFAITGALVGWLAQYLLHLAGLDQSLASLLTYPLGDPTYINPETGKLAFEAHNLLNNWPQWFGDYPTHIGWVIGLTLGIIAYFIRFGKFRNGSSLIVYMASGWLISFLAFPVLGSLFFTSIGGLRMTPPRSDDWAGITGVFIGTISWMRRYGLRPVAVASVMSGTIGGLGLSGIQWIKQLLMVPGNPRILAGRGLSPESAEFKAAVATWADWQHQNWHSFLEQSYGFVNGLAIVVALGFLATRIPLHNALTPNKPAQGKWTLGVATVFVLLALPYVNLVKNVEEWGKQLNPEVWTRPTLLPDGTQETAPALWDVPFLGHLPGVDFLHFTPEGWFKLTWLLLLTLFIILIRRHFREPIALVPSSWLGKGQLIFLILLWFMVVGNFERALVNWHPSRLLTEWIITFNAILATLLVLTVPTEKAPVVAQVPDSYDRLYKQTWIRAATALTVSALFFWLTNRAIYHYPENEKLDSSLHLRFGPEADWRARPNLKNAQHK
ncbi:hypothetical protein [Spirosoma foliorum]|uniref:Uncharacterized protein n=1 Tax=Spirosoma foliorum TaxID=2710596 RepID=A0A7G5GYI8_9BACT|nr:hypothetical protein [Spirosoma foliorum]QMW03930.1 hypothetical protein H3H32_02940 [Spirosoma foliorum]